MGVLWSAAVVRMAETKGRGNVCRLPLIIIYDPQFSSSPFQEGATELLRVARSASARATHSYNRPLLHLGGCIRSLSKLKNTPKALISGQKSTLILIKNADFLH